MKLNRMEMDILGLWGCPEYAATITRLAYVAQCVCLRLLLLHSLLFKQ